MGRKRRDKKHESMVKLPAPSKSSGYFTMGLVGLFMGLIVGWAFGKTLLSLIIGGSLGFIFMLAFNHILLYFGFGPNSGATPQPDHIDVSRAYGGSGFPSTDGRPPGGGGGDAG